MRTSIDMESPLGRLRLFAEEGGLSQIWLPGPDTPPAAETTDEAVQQAARQLEEYFNGRRTEFRLALRARGTAFQQAVWAELVKIPFGETRSYGEIARTLGRPTAFRAVGAANGRNPLAIVVPCHRVIASDGTLHGYAGGLPAKQWLLDHEKKASLRRFSH